MKRYLPRVIKISCFLLALALCVGVLQEYVLCRADHNRERLKGFYEEDKDSLDLVIIGASEVYSDFAPGYAYARDGISSYLFATQANSILNYQSQLKNVLSRQKDPLIVIELNGAVYGDEEEVTKEANLRNYADNVPSDLIKLEWIARNIHENHAEYLFPIMKYHGVWSDLAADQKYRKTIWQNKRRGYNYLKGILNETGVFRSTQRSMNSSLPQLADSKAPLTEIEEKGLRDLLEYCRSQGLKNVVFARFPHIVVKRTYSRFERGNTVGDIVKEYGFDYLNLERDIAETGLDETTDFYNLDHLNVNGQQKFTAYLTDVLKTRYGLSSHEKSDNVKNEWNECQRYYQAYADYSKSLIEKGETIELSEDCELIEKLRDYLPKK